MFTVVAEAADTAYRVAEAKAAVEAALMDLEETGIKEVYMAEAEELAETQVDTLSLTAAQAARASA